MKSVLVLLLALSITAPVMAQEPTTPPPTGTTSSPTSQVDTANSPSDKGLVDQTHKADPVKKPKKGSKGKKHGGKKHHKKKKSTTNE